MGIKKTFIETVNIIDEGYIIDSSGDKIGGVHNRNKRKLNLGGMGEKKGFIDIGLHKSANILHDLNVVPFPFYDNSIEEIYCSHTLEHLREPIQFFDECYRIMKKGAVMTIKVPHWKTEGSYGSLEHRYHFNENAIDSVTKLNSSVAKHFFTLIEKKVIRAKWLKWRKYEIQWVIKK